MKIFNLFLVAFLALSRVAGAGWTVGAVGKSINFTSLPHYFIQDDGATNPIGFDYVSSTFLC